MQTEPNRLRTSAVRAHVEPLERAAVRLPARLNARVEKPKHISSRDLDSMYLLMREYYCGVTENQFLTDLMEKTDVVILRDGEGEIRGFSTLLVLDIASSYGKVRTVFSGDTVVAKEFWGQKELGVAFLKHLFLLKLKNPLRPLYWMLISKGYKTYLLMANNFSAHYPRFERGTPAPVQKIMDDFYSRKFGRAYSSARGLVQPLSESSRLRGGVAAVTDELILKHPRVAFFARRNPRWADGVELACTAEMRLTMPITYFFKKTIFKKFQGRSST